MAKIEKLIDDIEFYINTPNGVRAEFEANGKSFPDPDAEEQNLRGYAFSQEDPLGRLVALEAGTLVILEAGPRFLGVSGVYIYRVGRDTHSEGSVITQKRTEMPSVEFIATHDAASIIAGDKSVKFVSLTDRSHIHGSERESMLKITWEEPLLSGNQLLKSETLVFKGDKVWRERCYARADRFGFSVVKSPLNDSSRDRAERVLLGIQATVRANQIGKP
jgi:hypothetical protein